MTQAAIVVHTYRLTSFYLRVCGSCNSPFPSFFFAMYRRCSIILLDVLLSVGPIIFNCRARCDGHIDPCDYHHAKSSCPPKSLTTCRVKDCIIIAISYSKLLQHYIRYVANMPKNSAAQEKKVNAAVRFLQTTIGVKVPQAMIVAGFSKKDVANEIVRQMIRRRYQHAQSDINNVVVGDEPSLIFYLYRKEWIHIFCYRHCCCWSHYK